MKGIGVMMIMTTIVMIMVIVVVVVMMMMVVIRDQRERRKQETYLSCSSEIMVPSGSGRSGMMAVAADAIKSTSD